MTTRDLSASVAPFWDESILPTLREYITIPNQSPAFDRDWAAHGHMERAVNLVADWVRAQEIPGLRLEIVRLDKRTPLIFIEVPGATAETVLLYGHLDKQPPMEGWRDGLGPWTPVVVGDCLYGRGAADDGYAIFSAVAAIRALTLGGMVHARCVVVIEACEESGSFDLPHYIAALKDRIGEPGLVICLDSGCGDYERLWVTTSLRGLVGGDLTVSTLREGVHSGNAGGIVPSSFRILRQLLDRIEDPVTGAIKVPELSVEIPAERAEQAARAAKVLGARVYGEFPFQSSCSPMDSDPETLILNRTWRPQLEITGAGGLPALEAAGNVLRPSTTVRLSLRLPPTVDPKRASVAVKRLLEAEPPYGAQVTLASDGWGASGWNAPSTAPWLAESVRRASLAAFGQEACFMGEGGTIPFMAMLGERFPRAQFLITGVLGPRSNAHGPNEFLHIPAAKKLTACVAQVLADHCEASRPQGPAR
jgi:acetylornithine deacetylase/succinyl-diaminopimelate desuccinylase-like protein